MLAICWIVDMVQLITIKPYKVHGNLRSPLEHDTQDMHTDIDIEEEVISHQHLPMNVVAFYIHA